MSLYFKLRNSGMDSWHVLSACACVSCAVWGMGDDTRQQKNGYWIESDLSFQQDGRSEICAVGSSRQQKKYSQVSMTLQSEEAVKKTKDEIAMSFSGKKYPGGKTAV
ncbi:hypothetical protein CEXT_723401 [Caerostris extrusa]|uniref:Uncharacterized protein n=1 Tax=Caerostris extrusa TaxID=172846 RepID=A0AAV4UU14_CAEEX|nr:hypothetical protein CEXT_723401 [Caerostris extrusa]